VGTKDYREALARLAKLGGMGKDEFDSCLNNTALENRIVEQRLTASQQLDVMRRRHFHQRQQIQRCADCGRVQQSAVEPCGEVVKSLWLGRLPP